MKKEIRDIKDLPILMTPEQVCEVLQISKGSFYKRAWRGELPIIKMGGLLRVKRDNLLNHLDKNSRGGNG